MPPEMTREQFLTGSAAVLAGAGLPVLGVGPANGEPCRRRLRYRGVCYEVSDGATGATSWSERRMRADLAAIAEELHANALSVFGTGVRRLTRTAEEAAHRGLHVWLQPRMGDVSRRDILDHLGETARQAERLRRQGASVDLSVGAEFVLFVPGIVPGANAVQRVENLLAGDYDPVRVRRRLREFTADAARVGRAAFDGRISYAAAEDEEVDWRRFDVVGIDYYSRFPRPAQHARTLRRYLRWGKPLAIAEFGTCTYAGAARRGGMAWDALDANGLVERGLVRDERAQARHIVTLLRVFESMGLDSAMVYQFVSPDSPHRRRPRRDLDMVSYGLVKPIWGRRDRPTPHWRWERKVAFRAIAREFRRAGLATGARPT